MVRIDTSLFASALDMAQICSVDAATARRYRREKKAPYWPAKLLDLYGRGRVLPEKWKYCFVNPRGNLEIYGSGEISEGDILNIQWKDSLHYQQLSNLQHELSKAQRRIEQLEKSLDHAMADKGDKPAANHSSYFRGRV
tara:strand:- start:2066 stop:2482 length:417 start_codon:yes stop_codon:yes gene_type:complete